MILALSLLASAGAPAGAAGAEASLEQVMHSLAESGSVRATYRERRYVALLEEPIETGGTLFFQPPDRMARRVESPERAWMAIRDDEVVLRNSRGEQRIDLGRSEVARSLVDGLAVVLRGDVALLTARYDVSFRADESRWQIGLTPRADRSRTVIASLVIDGAGDEIHRIEVREAGGDSTVTEVSGVETGLHFSPQEADEIFLLAPSPRPAHD